MKIRGVILAFLAMVVFFTCYACANEPEPEPVSTAKPVVVPYINKTINEVKTEYGYANATDGHSEEAGQDREEDGQGSDNLDEGTPGAVLTNAGRVETGEDADTMPELVGGESDNPVLTDWVYYGNCRITHYDAGPCCCGEFATGCTASGVLATINHTVASGEDLPFGTEVLINDQIYVVEDRGVGSYEFDIFVSDHETALAMGMYYTDVYVRWRTE